MIADCQAGKIDMVITKSISRFARNTADCLHYVRLLKDLGIGITFEREGINTLDGTGELLLTILSSLAQDESRNISENCAWGIRVLFQQGRMHLNTSRFLGYDKDKQGKLVINKEQAPIVRRIYSEFMDGKNPDVIAKKLIADNVPGVTGACKWRTSTIEGVLKNEKYMGDALLQKYMTTDYLSGKTVKNEGQLEQYYVRNDHEPIIEPTFWRAVQREIERRKDYREAHALRGLGRYTDEQPFSSRVLCAKCGCVFWRRTWQRLNGPVKVWQCGNRFHVKGGIDCKSDTVFERNLHRAFVFAWNDILAHRAAHMKRWKADALCENELVAYRAQQMMRLTEGKAMGDIDLAIVGKVLDHVVIHSAAHLEFHLLDGTVVNISVAIGNDGTTADSMTVIR